MAARQTKTKDLIRELDELRRRLAQLEAYPARSGSIPAGIVEFLPDAAFAIDKRGRIVAWNRAMEAMTGCLSGTMLGKGDYEYALPFYGKRRPVLVDLVSSWDEEIAKKYAFLERDGDTISVETVMTVPGGQKKIFWIKAGLIRDDQGRAIGAVEVIRDKTDTGRLQEEKYRSLFENSRDAILLTSPDGSILDANPAARMMFGRTVEEIRRIGRNGLVDTTDPRVELALREREKTGSLHAELTLIRATGEKFEGEVTSTVFTDVDGLRRTSMVIRDIAARKDAENALRESEERYRNVFERHAAVKILIDPDTGNIIEANEAAARYYGWSRDRLRQMNIRDINTLSPDEVKREVEKVRAEKRIRFEFRHRRADGSIRDVEVFSSNIGTSGKDLLHSIIHDITDRKRAEEALFAEKTFSDSILDSMPGVFYCYDDRLQFKRLNKNFEQVTGYSQEELSKMGPLDLFVGEDRPLVEQRIREVFARGESSVEADFVSKDGRQTPYFFTGRRVTIGGTDHLIGVGIDISAIRQVQAALKESEENFRRSLDESPLGVRIVSATGDNIYANRALLDIYGYGTVEELNASPIKERYTPESYEEYLVRRQRRERGELSPSSYEVSIFRKEGAIRHLQAFRKKILWDGKSQFQVLYIDITERKKAEDDIGKLAADLVEKNKELEEAYANLKESQNKIIRQEKLASIGQLAAGVAHEINNPMGFIASNLNSLSKYMVKMPQFIDIQAEAIEDLARQSEGSANLIKARVAEQRRSLKIDFILDDVRNIVTESLEGAHRIARIVKDLKVFSRVDEAGFARANIIEGIESTLNIVWNEIKYKATVKKEYGEMPLVMCNLGQLNQVFMNLLVNAAHAIIGKGEISIRTGHDDAYIFVSIADTGTGIPEDKLGSIFDPFYTTKKAGEGTGLGLSIANDIIAKHNGYIEVTSKAGEGAIFTVKIPIVEG